ncbi:MAG: glycosyl hydrolase 53 family protein [Polyangiaceae bacterium]|nr:glycosyl hydrolase 53 family protein [Polyangiaceae bacterium]
MTRARIITAAGGLLLTIGCGYRGQLLGELGDHASPVGGAGGADTVAVAAGTGPRFILGADLSLVQEQEESGLTFVDQGVTEDILVILRRHGFNTVRLRLFHDPASPCRTAATGDQTCGYQYEFGTRAAPYCDLAHTIAMAERVKAAGLGFLLDFHYSDTWADPDDQNKPLAWEPLAFTELAQALEDYTRETLAAFAAAGVPPDLVQLGNEITAGLLFPDGSSSPSANFPRFAALVRAAVTGAKTAAPTTPVLLHIEKPDDFSTSDWWLENMLAEGIAFDVLAQSCYPEWHGTSADWSPTLDALAAKYPELSFVVVEYSEEKRAVNDMVFALPDRRGLGTFVWEPTWWGEALFDREGSALVANELLGLYDQMARDYAAW